MTITTSRSKKRLTLSQSGIRCCALDFSFPVDSIVARFELENVLRHFQHVENASFYLSPRNSYFKPVKVLLSVDFYYRRIFPEFKNRAHSYTYDPSNPLNPLYKNEFNHF